MREHAVGDVVSHKTTGEKGQIVRKVNVSDILPKVKPNQRQESAYIVSLPEGRYSPAKEVLWFKSEVDDGSAPSEGTEHSTDTP
jgi:hypothetical protein